VLDSSRSMAAHPTELAESFKWMQANLLSANAVDLFTTQFKALNASADLSAKFTADVKALDPKQFTFYGSLQPNEMLTQFNTAMADLSKSTASTAKIAKYDAIIVMTDAGSYELTADRNKPVSLPAPLWMVHLGGLQPSYDDATLEAIQRGGGSVSTQIEEVAQRIATQPSLGADTSLLNVVDGYAWFLSQKPGPSGNSAGFDPMAARQWIAQVSQSVKPDQLTQLDAIHSVAKKNRIVSPYSSMLVLVEQRQKDALAAAEKGADRFKREVEDQQLPQPTSAIAPVSAVPEPSEWLLLLVGATGLVMIYRLRKQSQVNL
jgi:putative PEP-CTERM system integral membrane protein